MRSTIVAAAFVASAIAVPFQKRDVVTDVDMVYVTDVVTVTAGEPAAYAESTSVESATAESTPAESTPAVHKAAHYGHHSYHWSAIASSSSSSEAAPVEYTTSSSSIEVAPTSTSASEYVAPTTTSTSEYVAPKPSTTFTYVAPSPTSTYVAPTSTSVYVAPSPTSTSTSEWVAPTTYATSSSSAVSTTDSTSESPSKPTTYSEIVVHHHNLHRANHSAPDIAWDADLANTAQDIAKSCYYAHNTDANNGGYGQNIAAGTEPADISQVITGLFYNNEVNWFNGLYGEANPDMTNFESWGHFSQIVWKASTHVGCYTQNCTSSGLANVGGDVPPYFTVCNYKSPGNFGGEYGDNIGQSLNQASVVV